MNRKKSIGKEADCTSGDLRPLLSEVVEGFDFPVAIFDQKFALLICNQNLIDTFDFPDSFSNPGTSLASYMSAITGSGEITSDDPAPTIAALLGQSGTPAARVLPHIRPDGRIFNIEIVPRSEGGFISFFRPENAEQQSDSSGDEIISFSKKLQNHITRYEVALDNMIQGLAVFVKGERLVIWNRPLLEILGITDQDFQRGITRAELVTLLRQKNVLDETSTTSILAYEFERMEPGELKKFTFPILPGKAAEMSCVRLPDESVVITLTDVTQERLARRRLEESNESLTSFAYVASHDLQEPLRKIEAFGDRLGSRAAGQLDEQSTQYLDRMLDAARRMRALITDLLKYSRVATENRPFVAVNLSEIMALVLSDLQIRVEETSAIIEIGPMPKIQGDAIQIQMLFQNLLSNALKFVEPALVPKIEVTARKAAGNWTIEVTDNGIGFDEANLDKVFAVFQRLHGRTEYPGTGIGLATCQKITERHHGTLTARSKPGEGATFVLTLPERQRAGGNS